MTTQYSSDLFGGHYHTSIVFRPMTKEEIEEEKIPKFVICGCSEDMEENPCTAPTSFLDKLNKCIDFKKKSYGVLGCKHPLLSELPDDKDVDEVQYCLDFLQLKSDDKFKDKYCKDKYITIYSFIYGYLRITDEHYQYLLMNYLDNMGYMEHGSAIRCGWMNTDSPVYPRIIDSEIVDSITSWISKADNNGNCDFYTYCPLLGHDVFDYVHLRKLIYSYR